MQLQWSGIVRLVIVRNCLTCLQRQSRGSDSPERTSPELPPLCVCGCVEGVSVSVCSHCVGVWGISVCVCVWGRASVGVKFGHGAYGNTAARKINKYMH